jgi:hypothetical protein
MTPRRYERASGRAPEINARRYERHRWIASDDDAYCWVCGITESEWNCHIANAPMIEWDCAAVLKGGE